MSLNNYIADTHALYWYLTASPKLGNNARNVFREGELGRARIYIPSIVLAELYYLNIKAGKPLDFAVEYSRMLNAEQFLFLPFRAADLLRFDVLTAIPEMHDRIIAGAALERNCPCLTRDSLIVASGLIQIVW